MPETPHVVMQEDEAPQETEDESTGTAVRDDYAALAEAWKAKALQGVFGELEFDEFDAHLDAGTLHLLYGTDTPLVEAMLELGLMGCHVNEILGAGAVSASLADDLLDIGDGGMTEEDVEALAAQVKDHFAMKTR